jgi:glutathione peroxidase
MKIALGILLVLLVVGGIFAYRNYAASATFSATPSPSSFYDLTATTLEGQPFDFAALRGKPVMIVNTASKCGFTPQYAALEKLHESYPDDLVILGFPCNDFADQEPGSASEIGEFCQRNYGVSFPMMDKVHVRGSERHAVYDWLCDAGLNGVHDGEVKWNFHKFVIDRDGHLRGSFRSAVKPDDAKILNLLFSE